MFSTTWICDKCGEKKTQLSSKGAEGPSDGADWLSLTNKDETVLFCPPCREKWWPLCKEAIKRFLDQRTETTPLAIDN